MTKRGGQAITLLILGVFIILLQGTVLRGLFHSHIVVPNLFIPIIVCLAFYEVTPWGALLAFALGLEYDLLSGALLGPWAGTFVVLFGVLACGAQKIFIDSFFSVIVTVFLSSVVASGVYLLFTFSPEVHIGHHVMRLCAEAVATAVIAPWFFMLLRRGVFERGEHSRHGKQFL